MAIDKNKIVSAAQDDTELVKIIKADGTLKDNQEKRQLYITYATLFESELKTNLERTSIELDDIYMTGSPSSWQRFLNHASVKKYVEGFLTEKAAKAAAKQLGKDVVKTSDAIKMQEMIEKKKIGEDNSKLIVVFLPQKEYV